MVDPPRRKESVWDYPRPPRLEQTKRRLRITLGLVTVADTVCGFRVLETSHPPVYYLPQTDLAMHLLFPSTRRGSFCEWKGNARYWDLKVGKTILPAVAWSYPDPTRSFAPLADHLAFYPAPFLPPSGTCTVDDEQVEPQPGGFYGGWITRDLVGPFKGAPGTLGW